MICRRLIHCYLHVCMYTCSSGCGAPSVNYSGVSVLGVRPGGVGLVSPVSP